MLANFLGVLPILTPSLCALAFIMCLENIILSEVSQAQKAKSCALSYEAYRPNTKAAILYYENGDHIKERSCTRRGG
jgi:hypothetical protein